MNIESKQVQSNQQSIEGQSKQQMPKPSDKSFKQELLGLEEANVNAQEEPVSTPISPNANNIVAEGNIVLKDIGVPSTEFSELSNTIQQMNSAVSGQNIPQKNEFLESGFKPMGAIADNLNKEQENPLQMLNNDMNINKPQDKMQELKADINFSQSGSEAFSSFLGQNSFRESNEELKEDSSILSDMAENIAVVNKAMAMKNVSEIEEVGVIVDKAISHTDLNLTRNDIHFFVNLVHNKVNMDEVSTEEVKQVQVSERIFNMLAESMRSNKAFRLNFDNDISIIIKVSREGRISAHFMPGSDIAENYLRNNLSSLVQKFEEENIPYDELTQQRHKRNNDEQNNKKDKDNE